MWFGRSRTDTCASRGRVTLSETTNVHVTTFRTKILIGILLRLVDSRSHLRLVCNLLHWDSSAPPRARMRSAAQVRTLTVLCVLLFPPSFTAPRPTHPCLTCKHRGQSGLSLNLLRGTSTFSSVRYMCSGWSCKHLIKSVTG